LGLTRAPISLAPGFSPGDRQKNKGRNRFQRFHSHARNVTASLIRGEVWPVAPSDAFLSLAPGFSQVTQRNKGRNRFKRFHSHARNVTGSLIRGEVWRRTLRCLSLISTWLQPGEPSEEQRKETVFNGFTLMQETALAVRGSFQRFAKATERTTCHVTTFILSLLASPNLDNPGSRANVNETRCGEDFSFSQSVCC
jgi:hypothetical protein